MPVWRSAALCFSSNIRAVLRKSLEMEGRDNLAPFYWGRLPLANRDKKD